MDQNYKKNFTCYRAIELYDQIHEPHRLLTDYCWLPINLLTLYYITIIQLQQGRYEKVAISITLA